MHPATIVGSQLLAAFDNGLRKEMGFDAEATAGRGAEARERTASLALLLQITGEAVGARNDLDRDALVAEFESRAAAEANPTGFGGIRPPPFVDKERSPLGAGP